METKRINLTEYLTPSEKRQINTIRRNTILRNKILEESINRPVDVTKMRLEVKREEAIVAKLIYKAQLRAKREKNISSKLKCNPEALSRLKEKYNM